MNVLKNIFARIWAVWGLLSFITTFLIIFLPAMLAYIIPDPAGQVYFIRLSKYWMNVWLFLIGCPVKVTGTENFKPGETYVVVFNHNTLLDVPLSCPYVPGPNKTIAKLSFARIPVFGWFYRKGTVLVDRKSEKSRIKSFEDMKGVLAMGFHMCIYPEGTRNRTSEPLKAFYDGAFKLAVTTGKAIMPSVILGTKIAMPVNKTFYLLPVRLRMHFMPAVQAEETEVKELKERVYGMMKEYYVRESR